MSGSISKKNTSAAFKKHYPYEVVSSVNDSKLLANALSNTHRYQYKMELTVVGDPSIRPYDPIYLDGLPNNLSGYWTVIAVSHHFNKKRGFYMLDLVVGTEVLGDTNPDAYKARQYRDIEGELSGQALEVAESQLTQVSTSPNETALPDINYEGIGPRVAPSATAIPNIQGKEYLVKPPSFKSVKNKVSWSAKKGSKII